MIDFNYYAIASGVVLSDGLHLVGVVGLGLVLIQRRHHAVHLRLRIALLLPSLMHHCPHLRLIQRELHGTVQFPYFTLRLPLTSPIRLRLFQQIHASRFDLVNGVGFDAVLVYLFGQFVGFGEEVSRGETGVLLHTAELAAGTS
jgi:hypothetical protein